MLFVFCLLELGGGVVVMRFYLRFEELCGLS